MDLSRNGRGKPDADAMKMGEFPKTGNRRRYYVRIRLATHQGGKAITIFKIYPATGANQERRPLFKE